MPRPPIRDPRTDPAARLGKHLRRLRVAVGFATQAAAAARLDGYGEDSIQKAETGYQLPGDDLYAKLLTLYGASDTDRLYLGDLLEQARDSKGLVVEGFEPWPGIERESSFIREWNPLLVPGLLQVKEYALPLFRAMGKSREKAAELLDLRLGRQDILTGPDPVTGVFLIDESVLYRLVESPAVMVKQLDRMLALAEQPNVTIQIVRGAASLAGMFGAFELANGDGTPDTMLMWAVRDQTTSDSVLVREAIMIFELIRGRALNVEESRAVIMEARKQWESQQRT